jgi:hypothetical protein
MVIGLSLNHPGRKRYLKNWGWISLTPRDETLHSYQENDVTNGLQLYSIIMVKSFFFVLQEACIIFSLVFHHHLEYFEELPIAK